LSIAEGSNLSLDGGGDTYIDSPAANEIRVVTGGVARFRIDDAGNVGIGTSSPTAPLTVAGAAVGLVVALTDAASVATDLALGNNYSLTLAGNRTLANPTNIVAGQSGSLFITQDGTGSRTLAYGSYFKFVGGTAPVLSLAAAAIDRLDYVVKSTTEIHAVVSLDVK